MIVATTGLILIVMALTIAIGYFASQEQNNDFVVLAAVLIVLGTLLNLNDPVPLL